MPVPSNASRPVEALEYAEKLFHVLHVETDAIVLDEHDDLVLLAIAASDLDLRLRPRARELDRVGNEVDQRKPAASRGRHARWAMRRLSRRCCAPRSPARLRAGPPARAVPRLTSVFCASAVRSCENASRSSIRSPIRLADSSTMVTYRRLFSSSVDGRVLLQQLGIRPRCGEAALAGRARWNRRMPPVPCCSPRARWFVSRGPH